MKSIQISYQGTARISQHQILSVGKKLQHEIERLRAVYGCGYDSVYASINLVHDAAMHERVKELAREKKALGIECLVVIGIGGSSLGTQAIHEAIQGKLYNERSPEIKVYFIDTIDADNVSDILELIEAYLKVGKKILVNVVTKSGTTTETVANFAVVHELLERYYPKNYQNYVVVTTDKDSVLWKYAQEKNFACLEVPKNVGGRFSVLSPVGLFPCALLGIDIDALLQGASDSMQHLLAPQLEENPAAVSAILKYIHYKQNKIPMHVMFVFSVYLEALGKWYCQLMGESIGKEFDSNGNKVHVGITPIVSVGTTDLHSVGQLYLGGPYDKFITFCSLKNYAHTVKVPAESPEGTSFMRDIEGKPFADIMLAILEGVKRAYEKEERPFCELVIPERNPYYIGQFLHMYMVEIMYLGFLLQINPFDQPNVETYKQETREILHHE